MRVQLEVAAVVGIGWVHDDLGVVVVGLYCEPVLGVDLLGWHDGIGSGRSVVDGLEAGHHHPHRISCY